MRPAKSAQRKYRARGNWAMAIVDIPILSMLCTRMDWGQQRQRVLAENVSNADTPQFRPRDLALPTFDSRKTASPVHLATTESAHLPGMGAAGEAFRSEIKGKYDTLPSGNAVNLEEE